jgi:redox-sensitive bicupin YhaK (pirin superfamily)
MRAYLACMTQKQILGLHPSHRDDIADLVTRRPIPGPRVQQIDPFLFLNHHGPQVYPPNNQGLPFGPHPHRGFETVTFILEGELMHADSVVSRVFRKLIWLAVLRCRAQAVSACSVLWLGGFMVR